MDLIKDANLALRFLLELAALAALGYWGYRAGRGRWRKIALAIGAPLAAATVWAIAIAPKSAYEQPGALYLLLQAAVFGGAAVGLARVGKRNPALLLAIIAAGNAALMAAWGQ